MRNQRGAQVKNTSEYSRVISILVPTETKQLFIQQREDSLSPIYYTPNNETLLDKIKRKLQILETTEAVHARLSLKTSGELIAKTQVFWLSPSLYLPPNQMTALLGRLPQLRWVYSQMTGTEHLDANYFRERGIIVSNAGNLSSRRVAEMAIASIVSHAKRIPEHINMHRKRKWMSLRCRDLDKQTLGIIGTGNIGFETAKLGAALGMRVIGASRDPARFSSELSAFDEIVSIKSLEQLLRQSDYVVIAVPLNDETRGLIDSVSLNVMKSTACLVNIARGAIVDEAALCNALHQDTIGAAYIDVPTKIPPPRWSRLYRAPNLVLTHYSGANSSSVLTDAFRQFTAGIAAIREGREPANRVI